MGRGFQNPDVPWRELSRRLSGTLDSTHQHTHSAHAPSHAESAPPAPSRSLQRGVPVLESPGVPYAELHAHSSFSFLDGASSPEDLVKTAAHLGLQALALTDHNGLYGAAEFAAAAADFAPELGTVYGAEVSLTMEHNRRGTPDPDHTHLLLLARGAPGYRSLASAITHAQLDGGQKGVPRFTLELLQKHHQGSWLVLTGCRKGPVHRAYATADTRSDAETAALRAIRELIDVFGADHLAVELTNTGVPGDDVRCAAFASLAKTSHLRALATTGAHAAVPAHRHTATAFAAARAGVSMAELDPYLPSNGGAILSSGATVLARHHRTPEAVHETVQVAQELAFELQSAKPHLPRIAVPDGHTQISWLRHLTYTGARKRYPQLSDSDQHRIERELRMIEQKDFAGYFLIVHDIVREARERGILCQGRGSAANSAVCYCLGITAVDSIAYDLPFERFMSSMREEEPDIDVDFDAQRREEIIQYVYDTYGRFHAAQVANFITYRPRAAVRDAAKALGFSPQQAQRWTKTLERHSTVKAPESPGPRTQQLPTEVATLAEQLLHAPQHLGIHSGGMVLTAEPLGSICPIEQATKPGRTVLQWDKDSCASMGLVKFDLLGLGMLHALQQSFDVIRESTGETWTFETIPKEEPAVYDMLCRADAIGVFQVESRAQLNTLPRMLPRRFTDLVIEIALIRPGPVQGGAVHPYLKRRAGREEVRYAHPMLRPVLERTLGIPLFQEQVMQMATTVGGCTAEDADLLRRAMGSKRGIERIDVLKQKLFDGMAQNGITGATADAIYTQIESFAGYGFAESHAISFALIVYASAWVKLHYPAAFLTGLLRAQPMGFYAPRALVADAKRHGVTTLPVDVLRSDIAASLEALAPSAQLPCEPSGQALCTDPQQPAVHLFDPTAPDRSAEHRRDRALGVRLGLTSVRGIDTATAERILQARTDRPFHSIADLASRAQLDRGTIEALARAGALDGFGMSRREALWHAEQAAHTPNTLQGLDLSVQAPLFPMLTEHEQIALDMWTTGIPQGRHPLALLRPLLDTQHVVRSDLLHTHQADTLVTVAGIVTHRQRPGTAHGITFMTLEDEHGSCNVIIWAKVWQRHRLLLRTAPALIIRGRLERSPEGLHHIIGQTFQPLTSPHTGGSRDFQ